jgi:hypothetical protein
MDLSAVVAKMGNTIREMIGANIALQLNLEREGLWVKGTPMEQVLQSRVKLYFLITRTPVIGFLKVKKTSFSHPLPPNAFISCAVSLIVIEPSLSISQ